MTVSVKPLCVAALLLVAACDETPPTASFPESLDAQLRRSIGRWGVVPIAEPPWQDPALVALGRALMFDKILSGNRDISCATCHEPALHATDGLPLAIGTGGTGTGTARTLWRALGEGEERPPDLAKDGDTVLTAVEVAVRNLWLAYADADREMAASQAEARRAFLDELLVSPPMDRFRPSGVSGAMIWP